MNSFHVVGGILAIWAVLVAAIGIMRADFPASGAVERLVGAITVLLVAGAVGTAIYTAAQHKGGGEHEAEAEAALVR